MFRAALELGSAASGSGSLQQTAEFDRRALLVSLLLTGFLWTSSLVFQETTHKVTHHFQYRQFS